MNHLRRLRKAQDTIRISLAGSLKVGGSWLFQAGGDPGNAGKVEVPICLKMYVNSDLSEVLDI